MIEPTLSGFSASLLVQNLKALNAKERDHLMRLAYLGDGEHGPYADAATQWLSPRMNELLREKTGLPNNEATRCIFAGMDYHLDWVHAALTLSNNGKSALDALKDESHYPCRGIACSVNDDDPTLRPVIGTHEDVDLLAVFDNGKKAVMLFVEAKGAASVDKIQLARKLIRLGRIFESPGVRNHLDFKFVLIAPERPKIWPFIDDDFSKRSVRSKHLADLIDRDGHTKAFAKEDFCYVPLEGFPAKGSRVKVERIRIADKPGEYERWEIVKR